ncbi:MAG: hypothetical protein EXS43_11460 [Opitutus sp.]|nr:hypothetical protein [Opitutus sp.]
MDRLALDEIAILVFADLVLDFVDRKFRFEVEEVVEHFHPAAGKVIEQVRVRAGFLVENVGQDKKLFFRIEERLLDPLEAHLGLAEVLFDAKRDERVLEHVLIETVIPEGIDELGQVGKLARIDDAQAVNIPPDRVARFCDPPIMVVAEPHDAPAESGNSFSHGYECEFLRSVRGEVEKTSTKGAARGTGGWEFFLVRKAGNPPGRRLVAC